MTTVSAPMSGAAKLRHVLTICLDEDENRYQDSDVYRALDGIGVTEWSHLLLLNRSDIERLRVPARGSDAEQPLALVKQRLLIAAICLYHHMCHKAKGHISVIGMTKRIFDDYRVSVWEPHAEIVPWNSSSRIARPVLTQEERDLATWDKNNRPTRSDYKEFRDEAYWFKYKETFQTTLEAHGLSHLIDAGFTVTNTALDDKQKNWLYKVLQDTMVCANARSIVTDHIGDKDTREIWRKLNEYYNGSMAAITRCTKLSTYVTSADITLWKGSQQSFIANFKEQIRQYNELSDSPYTDVQQMQFLEQAVVKAENLAPVRRMQIVARKAAGVATAFAFADYIAALLDQATVHDNANYSSTARTRPNTRRRAYKTEIEFDDGSNEFFDHAPFENHMHDIEFDFDTNVETLLEVHQADRRSSGEPRKVMMNATTWRSLTKDDQTAWDKLSI